MIDQPNASDVTPPQENISCGTCAYSRCIRMSPTDLQRIRTCFRLPPHPVVLLANGGAQVMPSMHPPVADFFWCFEWREAQGDENTASDVPKIVDQRMAALLKRVSFDGGN